MKYKRDRPPQLFFVYRSLFICLVILVVVLAGGTIYGVFLHINSSGNIQTVTSHESEKGQTFTGIGRIRASTIDPQPGTVILSISFKYDPNDKAFSEELALRVKDFRDIILNYIGSLSLADLQKNGEEKIKIELLRRLNAILKLGQIDTLYFGDFMIIG